MGVRVDKKLHSKFLDRVNRMLWVYGEGHGLAKILKREGLVISHTESLFRVRVEDENVFMYVRDQDRTAWASDRKVRDALKKIDAIFVLEDLARL